MKKLCKLISLVLCLCSLISCKGNNQTDIETGAKNNNVRNDSSVLLDSGNENNTHEYQLEMVVAQGGLLNNPWAISNTGCYEMYSNGNYTGNILYTDAESRQRIYLSPDLSSDHRSEADPSYIADTLGGVFLFAAMDHLFIHSYGFEETVGTLYMADLNGENRKKIMEFRNYLPITGSIVSDGKYLYTLLTKNSGEIVLARISVDNGDILELCPMADENFFIMEAFNDCIIIKAVARPASDEYADVMDVYLNTTHIVYRYSITENQLTEVFQWQQDNIVEMYDGSLLYIFDILNDCLKTIDLRDNTETIVIASLSGHGIDKDEISGILSIQDNHMLYAAGELRYILELTTLEIREMKNIADDIYPAIIASYGDKYLITSGYLEIPTDSFDPAGNPITYDMIMDNLALIDIEDYWQSNYDLEPIKNVFLGE